jgi:hypothetical protein
MPGNACFSNRRNSSELPPISQVLSECAGLEADLCNLHIEFIEDGYDSCNISNRLTLSNQLTLVINNADVGGAQ